MTRGLPKDYLPFIYGRKNNIESDEQKVESTSTSVKASIPHNADKQILQLKKMLYEERQRSEYYRRKLRRAEEENTSLRSKGPIFENE